MWCTCLVGVHNQKSQLASKSCCTEFPLRSMWASGLAVSFVQIVFSADTYRNAPSIGDTFQGADLPGNPPEPLSMLSLSLSLSLFCFSTPHSNGSQRSPLWC